MPDLVPVDHDPFADLTTAGDPEAAGMAAMSQTMAPAVTALASSAAQNLYDVINIPRNVYEGKYDIRDIPEVGRQFAGDVAGMGLGIPAPAGAVLRAGGGLRGGGIGGGRPPTPLTDALVQNGLVDELRTAHLARDGGLPLSGATSPIQPPPHIQTMADVDGLVGRYADLAQEGVGAKDWYLQSGDAIARAAGDPDTADKFAAALARTSPRTNVAENVRHAINLHNQAMLGDPLSAGAFPNKMGAAAEATYYGGEPVTGEKIGPFMGAVAGRWNPDFEHTFVNDIHNMRALEYPGTEAQRTESGLFNASPSLGQHNFARVIADRAADELERRTGTRWEPHEMQAASWAAIKARNEGAPISDTAFNFADGLGRHYGQASWESAPGLTTGHMPEYHSADLHDRQAFHDAVRNVLVDDQGRDIVARHFGLLTGPSFDAPGVYLGRVSPGTQSQIVLGQAPSGPTKIPGWKAGVDPASQTLLDATEATRALLLRQDAYAWHKPTFIGRIPAGEQNLADVRVGRQLSMDEAADVARMMHEASGTDFFSPIATPNGYRLINHPEATGLGNKEFQAAVDKAVQSSGHSDAEIVAGHAHGNYVENDWKANPNGENYLKAISGTGRPDLQRASAEVLAALGPRISQIEDSFAHNLGWTPNPAGRVWDNPAIAQHAGAVIPTPPRPWVRRPAPPEGGPPMLPAMAKAAAIGGLGVGGALQLVPVDHDPFGVP